MFETIEYKEVLKVYLTILIESLLNCTLSSSSYPYLDNSLLTMPDRIWKRLVVWTGHKSVGVKFRVNTY